MRQSTTGRSIVSFPIRLTRQRDAHLEPKHRAHKGLSSCHSSGYFLANALLGFSEVARRSEGFVGSRQDEAFISVAVAKRCFDAALGARVLAFSKLKRRAVARVVADLGLVDPGDAARIARLARYRIARADDKVYAEVAARAGIIDRREAAEALVKQRDLYAAGRGFIRLSALFRSEKRLTPEQDRILRDRLRAFEEAPKKECPNDSCRAMLLVSDERCPTCGRAAPTPRAVAQPSGSDASMSGIKIA
jgi:hypothetical protein